MHSALANLPGFLPPAAQPRSRSEPAPPRLAVTALIVATTLLSTVHTTPFRDLQLSSNIEASAGGNLSSQVAYTLLFLAACASVAVIGFRRLAPLITPINLCLVGWILVSTILSAAPAQSARRLALTFMCMFLGIALVLLARSVRHLARALAWTAFWILLLSYLSVALAPDLAMHTRLDVREPNLAGNWRGPFDHKNEAGSIMAQFVFIGLLAWGTGSRLLGAIVAAGAAVFLAFTQSKTAGALVPLILLQLFLVRRITATVPRLLVLLGPAVLIGAISLGAAFHKPMQDLLSGYFPDAEFTGRTDIWKLAVDNIVQKPLFGWGFGAFWGSEAAEQIKSNVDFWVTQADHAHNSYLDTALFMGVPGLLLTVVAFVAVPFRDVQRGGARMDSAASFFVAIWLFTLCTSLLESVLFQGNGLLFILFTASIAALRYRTLAPIRIR